MHHDKRDKSERACAAIWYASLASFVEDSVA